VTQLQSSPTVEVGDPRRRQLGWAAVGTLVVAALFVVFALAVKQFRVLSDHVPWQNDPYDAVVSFTVFFISLTGAMGIVRISLCRRNQPLPVARVISVLRGGRVLVGAMLVTVLADWVSIILGADRATWNNTTPATIAVLAVVTVLLIAAAGVQLRASQLTRGLRHGVHGPDWFSELVSAAELYASWLGPLRVIGVRVIRWIDRRLVLVIRRDPVIAAALAALAFGSLLALNTLLREGPGPAVWLDILVGGCGMFAFLVAAGAYMELVGASRPAAGTRRRVIDAAVAGCAAVPAAVAFRAWLWWIVGTDAGGALRLGELLLVVGTATALIVYSGETLFRLHRTEAA
jgi:hypothetical protein